MNPKTESVSLKKIAVARKDLFTIPLEHIHVDPDWNVRIKTPALQAHIKGLAVSIAEIGVQQPVTLRQHDGRYYLTDGFCRHAAAKLAVEGGADIKGIPARIENKGTNIADHTLSMLVRNDGKPLATIEQARVVKQLIGYGWSPKDIQKKTGKSGAHMANLLLLNAAHPEVIEIVEADKISVNLVLEVLRDNTTDEALPIVKRLVAKAEGQGKSKAKKSVAKGMAWGRHGKGLYEHLKGICDYASNPDNNLESDAFADMLMAAREDVDNIAEMLQALGE